MRRDRSNPGRAFFALEAQPARQYAAAVKEKVTLTIVAVVAIFLCRGLIVRVLIIPWRVHSSWVEEMPRVQRGLAESESRSAARQDIAASNEKIFEAYHVFRAGKGKYGLKRQASTTEGTPLVYWILVEDGRVTFIHDASRELLPFVRTQRPDSLQIGFYRFDRPSYPEWIEDELGGAVSNELYMLRLQYPEGGYSVFY
jgi:hypothetical protein